MQEILTLARTRPEKRTSQHSPLYEWLWARHETLVADLNPPQVPNWELMAEGFAKQGVLDGKAKPPTPTVVRKTWAKVNLAKGVRQRQRNKHRAAAAEDAADQTQSGASTPPSAIPPSKNGMLPSAIHPAEEEPPKFKFGFARAKDWTKETDKGDQ